MHEPVFSPSRRSLMNSCFGNIDDSIRGFERDHAGGHSRRKRCARISTIASVSGRNCNSAGAWSTATSSSSMITPER